MSRPVVRDYKRSRGSRGFDARRWREFSIGLGIGLAVAVVLFAYQRNAFQRAMVAAEEPGPGSAPPRAAKGRAATEAADTGEDAPATQYDFYDMLPKFEVVVPERDQEVKRDAPRSPIERPGVYVLQAGSYRKLEDAQRVQNQLLKLGVEANLQRVAVDADEWHRVRIGPLTDLDEVNRLRTRLRASGLEPLVIRVGD